MVVYQKLRKVDFQWKKNIVICKTIEGLEHIIVLELWYHEKLQYLWLIYGTTEKKLYNTLPKTINLWKGYGTMDKKLWYFVRESFVIWTDHNWSYFFFWITVAIRIILGPQNPWWLKRLVFWMKACNRGPVILTCPSTESAEHRTNFCSHAFSILDSLYAWNFLKLDEKQYTAYQVSTNELICIYYFSNCTYQFEQVRVLAKLIGNNIQ